MVRFPQTLKREKKKSKEWLITLRVRKSYANSIKEENVDTMKIASLTIPKFVTNSEISEAKNLIQKDVMNPNVNFSIRMRAETPWKPELAQEMIAGFST